MANIGDVFLTLLADDSRFAGDVQRKAGAAGDKGGQTLGQRMGVGMTRGLTVAGGAVGVFTAGAIENFGQFDDQMRQVFSIMPGISQDAMDRMREDVKSVSAEYGIMTDELIPALGTAIGSGIPEENAFSFLRVAAKAAKAGATDADTSVKALSASINAFQIPVEDADKVADSFFQAIDKGVTTFPELAGSISQVAPQAAALGLSLEDVLAPVTAMTLQGTSTSEAMTQVNASLIALQRTTPPMQEALKNLGFETGQAALESLGYQGTMEALRGEADRMGVPLIKLTGRMEGASAILQLTGDNTQRANDILEGFGNTTGKVDAAFQMMEGGIGGAARRLGAQLGVFALGVGETFAGIGPMLLALNQGGQLFGVSPARMFGGLTGALTGRVIPGIIRVFRGLGGRLAPVIGAQFASTAVANAVGDGLGNAMSTGASSSKATAGATAAGGRLAGLLHKGAALALAGLPLLIIGASIGIALDQAGEFRQQREDLIEELNLTNEEALALQLSAMSEAGRAMAMNRGAANQFRNAGTTYADALTSAMEKQTGAKAPETPEAAADALAAGEGEVTGAVQQMVGGVVGAVDAAAKAAGATASKTPGEIADGIRSQRQAPRDAMSELIELMKNPMTRGQEAARIAGQLTSGRLAQGMRSRDPLVKAQAEHTQEVLLERLRQIAPTSNAIGKEGMDALRRAMRSKNPQIRTAAQQVMAIIEARMNQTESAATASGGAIASNVASGMNRNRYLVVDAAEGLANAVGNRIVISSPAKEGPLSKFGGPEGMGRRIADFLARGLRAGMADVSAAMQFAGPRAALAVPGAPSVRAAGFGASVGTAAAGGMSITNNLNVEGMVKVRNPLEGARQLSRFTTFGESNPGWRRRSRYRNED